MKNLKKILYSVLCAGALFSCAKEDMTVEKNNDLSWEIDESIINNDIRTRIGYDPRFEYSYFVETEIDLPMLSLGDISLSGKRVKIIEVGITKALEKDVKFSIVYDDSKAAELKNTYTGYELGDASLVTITESEKTLKAGETSLTFEITVENNSNFEERVFLPFTLNLIGGDDVAKIYDVRKTFVAKLYPQEITLSLENSIVNKSAMKKEDGSVVMNNKTVNVTVKASQEIPDALQIGLVRESFALEGLPAPPEGIEGTLPKADIQNKKEVSLDFDLQNTEELTEESKYGMPLTVVIYDTNGVEHKQDVLVSVFIKVGEYLPGGDNVTATINDSSSDGTAINKNIIKVSGTGLRWSSEFIDDIRTGYNYGGLSPSSTLIFNFSTLKKVKSVVFMLYAGSVGSVKVSASNNSGDFYVEQGTATFSTDESQSYLKVTFNQAITIDALKFENFDRNNIYVREIDFYEE